MSSEKITIHPHGSLIQRNNCVHETMFAKVEHMKITYTMIHKIKERIVITKKKKELLLETVKQLKRQHINCFMSIVNLLLDTKS